ncbi:MAG: hypothetical protein ACTJLM_03740 [Ehrlichia sp.]
MTLILTVPGVNVIEFASIDTSKLVVCLVCTTLKVGRSTFVLKFHTFFNNVQIRQYSLLYYPIAIVQKVKCVGKKFFT